MNTKPTLGWQCPCCSTIYSPAVRSCACQKPDTTEKEWERLKKRVKRDAGPPDPETQKAWHELWEKAQAERAKNPLPPLQYGLPLPSQLFDLEPVCVIPKYIRTHRRPTPGIADPS